MYKPMIKLWFIVSFAVYNVFSSGTVALKTSYNTQIKFLEENSDPCFNNPCRNDGVCTVNNTDYICSCKEPFRGKECEIHPCHSSPCLNEGACIAVENTYGCVCNEPFHGRHCQNDPCSSGPCQHEGVCSVAGIDFQCSCKPPFSGKQCEIEYKTTAPENEITTTYSECDCGANSTGCHFENGTKVCACESGYAQDNAGLCRACECGKNSYDCKFTNDWKKCYCNLYYAELDGKCIECNCESGGICEFENGTKTCSCFPHQRYFRGKCTYCYCGDNADECGFFDDGRVRCDCQEGYIQRNDFCVDINSTLNESTTTGYFTTGMVRPTTDDECYCGVNSVSCYLWRGKKVCNCQNNYAQKNETCAETCNFSDRPCLNGGHCSRNYAGESNGYFCHCTDTYAGPRCETDVCESMRYSCSYKGAVCRRRGETGVCECPQGTTRSWLNDMCEEICNYRTCLNGRCEVTGNSSYICICDENFYGLHCEIGWKRINYQVPWASFIILSVGIVIFSIASIIAVQWVKKLRKKVEEDAKGNRNA